MALAGPELDLRQLSRTWPAPARAGRPQQPRQPPRRQLVLHTARQAVRLRAGPMLEQRAPELRDEPRRGGGEEQQGPEQSRSRPPAGSRNGASNGDGAGAGASRGAPRPRTLWRRALRELSNFPVAIGEMCVIAGLSAIGTVIEQNKSLAYYQEAYPDEAGRRVLGWVDWRLIKLLQWDHIYTAPYFLAGLVLLAASLAACTATRQWPMVKVARRWRFAGQPNRLFSLGRPEAASTLPAADVRDLAALLRADKYQVFLKDGCLYAFKGLVGKLGPIGVHASMLFCLAGIAWGGLGGMKGSVMLPEGGEYGFVQALRPSSPLAGLSGLSASGTLRVNNFNVLYKEDGGVDQFTSDLSVTTPNQGEVLRKTISVNDPLRWQGITAYQTDYAMAALTVHATGSPLVTDPSQPINLPMADLEGKAGVEGKAWATFLPAEAPTPGKPAPRGVAIVARDFQLVSLYNADGSFAGVRRVGSGNAITVEGLRIVVDDIVGATGLELKVDPGVPAVYAGFAGLMVTVLVSWLSHRQVWAVQEGGTLHVTGRGSKAPADFGRELGLLLDRVPERRELMESSAR